jgi:WD40 repeat protein
MRVAYAPTADAWACASRQQLHLFEGDVLVASASAPGDLLSELTFSDDGTRVLAAPLAYDRDARDWSPRPPAVAALGTGLDPGVAAGFSPFASAWASDASALCIYGEYRPPRGLPRRAGARGPTARVVVLDRGEPRVLWEGARSEPRAALLVTDTVIAWGGRAINVCERDSARPVAVLEPFAAVARVLRTDPSHRMLAAGAADGSVALWDTQDFSELARWSAHPGEASGLAWLPGSASLATGGDDGAVRVWSTSGEPLAEIDVGEPVTGLAPHPGGARLLAARAGGAGVVALDVA